ncbi:LytR cell envelope-related transcriptional attenuator [Blastococcus tunisiensis]|uniref:LytR cell envelope-related transcriptional attenuator n=1 Tax=Blastococcus tunisiensis TaxID=1798228 RepID=A0A1I1Y4R5_9ACTN|nr:LytR cell envelope-related transcriptional attenuator [Blastococcus sp. DSM 46838]
MSRSRLPLPPVPAAASRAGTRATVPPRPVGPLTSVAPFEAVPAPEPVPGATAGNPFEPAAPAVPARGDLLERSPRVQSAAPDRSGPGRPDAERSLTSTGRSGLRTSEPAPRVPSQTTASGSSSPAYGDWTKPSRPGESVFAADPEFFADAPSAGAPGTTMIPERSVRRGRSAPVEDADLEADLDGGPAPVRGPGTGPVGGRAAMRAERQAADAARRKKEGRKGSAVAVLEEDQPRASHRVVKALVAMTVVALGVLGVYTFVSPQTEETATRTPADVGASAPVVPDVEALPELPADPIEVEPIVAAPIRVPVTVLNSTDINGLAAKVSGTIAAGGWETPAVGAYLADDVAASTVFFTEGDENQRQAAVQLIEMFPQLQGPTPRFFELPAEVAAPGLVVVTTGDWQP